jgi:hypothetical protein
MRFLQRSFQATRRDAKCCSDLCRAKLNIRKRRMRALGSVDGGFSPGQPSALSLSPSPSPLVAVTTVTEEALRRAGKLGSPQGAMLLVIADRLDHDEMETCAGLVALSRELDRLLGAVLKGSEEPDKLDELERRRREKAARTNR